MWQEKDKYLEKTFEFENFNDAWNFIQEVAKLANQKNHHPSILWHYNKVCIQCNTHDKNHAITELDYDLAKAIDTIL